MSKKCLNCGACCRDCPNLIFHQYYGHRCAIWTDRLGFIWIDKDGVKRVCCMRSEMEENFPNCPYNV